MFKAAKTVDFLFLTYYTDGSKQRKRLSSLIRLYFPLYLSRRSVSFSALRTERPINFLCRRRAAEWMIVMEKFDSLIIGEVAQDTNVDFDGTVVQAVGGAVYYSGCAAANMGHKIAVLPKADLSQLDVTAAFHEKAPSISVFPLNSPHSFVTKNVYHTADRERRTSTVDSLIAPYTTDEVPVDQIDAAIWHLAGLAGGDIPNEMIPFAAKHAMVAIDVQTMLRWVENGGMVYHDWKEKKELLPYIRFLKTDAAEAEILTGLTDRAEAAKVLYGWGAKEILITHNTEVLVYDGHEIYTCPIKARNLSGRTGRGDTTFAGYINERLTKDIPTALQTATALVSLKMETPSPFTGTRQDVEDYIKLMY